MNKKKVSVVMAGAMLASSVAPVLAETAETTHGKMGLFINDLEALMNTKKYYVADKNEAGKSVYRFQLLDENGNDINKINGVEGNSNYIKGVTLFEDASLLKELNKDKVYTVKVYELGSVEKNGSLFSTGENVEVSKTYDKDSFNQLVKEVKENSNPDIFDARLNGWITNIEVNSTETKVIITLGSKDANGEFNKIECAVGTPNLNFAEPVDKDGNELKNLHKDQIQSLIAGFKAYTAGTTDSVAGSKAKLVHEVKVLNGDKNYTVKVDELYDGFMLTEAGHKLMNAVKASKNELYNPAGTTILSNGTERSFTITLTDENNTKHVVKVVGDSLHMARIQTLKDWLLNEKANVELLAGEDRYATAVEIAETYLAGQYKDKACSNLVLINGKALVDGLAAAPYARLKKAPILLTEEDKLPKETKAFMKELISKHQIGSLNNKDLTVTIIGGEAVVSNSVVRELKDYGFKVKRLAGDDREETSLAVAHQLNNTNKAFVVGANGEADAMSIASAASKEGTPIIVAGSAKNGLSTDGLNEVGDYEEVEIVGGTGVISQETEDAIKELVYNEKNVTRINGKDRYETNALVIKKYHHGFEDALIAKDGMRNKSELIDALPASLFASDSEGVAAPIVLATDNISDEQLNQLVLNAKKPSSVHKTGTVYQVGNGVARSVMETVVTKLGLNR